MNVICVLNQELEEMRIQYIDCYSEIVKLTQTTDCLRNSNLDLEVDKYNLNQDIEELNLKLAKYKNNVQILEDNIRKVLRTNEVLETDIAYMKNEMTSLAKELQVLQELLRIVNDARTVDDKYLNLTQTLQNLQQHSLSLEQQLKQTQDQVIQEAKLNEGNSNKIEELLKQLELKTNELEQYELESQLTKSKLEQSSRQSKEYLTKIEAMEKQIVENEEMQMFNEQKTEELVYNCNKNLVSLKQKVDVLNKMLNEKSDEMLQLHAELSIKADMISNLKNEIESMKHGIQNAEKLNQNIQQLEEQISSYKLQCTDLDEKYQKCKLELENVKQHRTEIEQGFVEEKKSVTEKLTVCQNEEVKLNKIITELKAELEQNKMCMTQKDEELKKLSLSQEEVISLKEEINRVTQLRNRVLRDNEMLEEKILKLNLNTSQFENHNKLISQQLEKCLQELNVLQNAKEKLEERNARLETDLEQMQRAFTELNQEIRYKNESVVNLEHELSETKCSRDEICAESRIVVGNVRAWLEEQKCINVSLQNVIKEKNVIIEELNLEKNLLLKNIKDVYNKYNSLSQELYFCKEYLSNMNDDQFGIVRSMPSIHRSQFKWGSQGSVSCVSPAQSPVLVEERGFEYNMTYADSDSETSPVAWMQKVENMNLELLKSEKKWKTKMGAVKKLKPVKDTT